MTDETELRNEEEPEEPAEASALEGDEEARRRVTEFDAALLDCEHPGDSEAERTAVEHSAQLLEGWEKAAPLEREKLLNRVGQEMMHVHEAPPGELFVGEMPQDVLGQYDDLNFITSIDRGQLAEADPHDALETYLHEYRHTEQHYEALQSQGALAHRVDPERAAALDYNLNEHYIDGERDSEGYERQLAEVDARRFAEATTGKILEARDELPQQEKK
jgi:hypothetical protein